MPLLHEPPHAWMALWNGRNLLRNAADALAGQVEQKPGASEEGGPANGRFVSSGGFGGGAELPDGSKREVPERLL